MAGGEYWSRDREDDLPEGAPAGARKLQGVVYYQLPSGDWQRWYGIANPSTQESAETTDGRRRGKLVVTGDALTTFEEFLGLRDERRVNSRAPQVAQLEDIRVVEPPQQSPTLLESLLLVQLLKSMGPQQSVETLAIEPPTVDAEAPAAATTPAEDSNDTVEGKPNTSDKKEHRILKRVRNLGLYGLVLAAGISYVGHAASGGMEAGQVGCSLTADSSCFWDHVGAMSVDPRAYLFLPIPKEP